MKRMAMAGLIGAAVMLLGVASSYAGPPGPVRVATEAEAAYVRAALMALWSADPSLRPAPGCKIGLGIRQEQRIDANVAARRDCFPTISTLPKERSRSRAANFERLRPTSSVTSNSATVRPLRRPQHLSLAPSIAIRKTRLTRSPPHFSARLVKRPVWIWQEHFVGLRKLGVTAVGLPRTRLRRTAQSRLRSGAERSRPLLRPCRKPRRHRRIRGPPNSRLSPKRSWTSRIERVHSHVTTERSPIALAM